MFSLILWTVFSSHVLGTNDSVIGKTFHFKFVKNNNEFKMHNRVFFLNHNITDQDYVQRRVWKQKNTADTEIKSNYYLDEEWEFDHSTVIKRSLPMFIEKFYEEHSLNIENSPNMRILFNTQWNTSSTMIKFNLNTLRATETMLDAHLYLYWALRNDSKIHERSALLRLYQIYNVTANDTELLQNPDVHKLSNVIYTSKARKGWQVFNITKTVNNWMAGEANMGLFLTISLYDSNKLIEIFNDTSNGVYSTFVAVSVKNQGPLKSTVSVSQQNVTEGSCRKVTWKLNFKQLGWDSFIISPANLQASDCSGDCAQLGDMIMNHVKLLEITERRTPRCVPSSYTSLPIMYYDKYNNVVLKQYDNIIVTNCGCR